MTTAPDATSPSDLPRRSREVQAALESAGASGRIRLLPDSARTAREAADAMGCDVGAIANSLVIMADGAPILALTSGAHRVDFEVLERALGVVEAHMANADEVRSATGQVIGGVAPLGHPAPLRTAVDEALRGHEQLWAAGGTPHTLFPTTFDELVRITGGEVVQVAHD
ncbi:YbaK/EbsC family protein [Arsenicicoccus sp. oral taxon 190]|uniref:YbaK/EbsC family protein n=1 Tax=Arsenicicoccus sp. oral taxon 190 TaxID=1658671 RepID=UPI000679F5E5|nr:YbaK/EbsC family protein [Arsenicicoccus sp. oral taxon 190]AKT50269.1 prolyl-tRNA synthetase [Arsenicicoccus sp. oral taxon 190]